MARLASIVADALPPGARLVAAHKGVYLDGRDDDADRALAVFTSVADDAAAPLGLPAREVGLIKFGFMTLAPLSGGSADDLRPGMPREG